ncbi:MAG: efflux RND transporter periplasmic adaptor subunit [Candidatus Eremiobacteraeota bacterium]|nr:efflux RND transporter periplasmic adaptor subunit [Candidatus Eremiobacteraeota bacterium]
MKARAAAFVLATLVAPVGCGHGNEANEANVQAPPPSVVVQTVRRERVPISEDFEGTFGAIESVQVRARVEGTLESAPFKEGDLVRRGDLIFRIQDNEYVAALRSAQAQLAQARGNTVARQAALTRANLTVARNRPLAADQAIPQKDLDNAIQNEEIAKGDVLVARAQIASAEAAIDNAQINVGYTTVYAPVTGLIGFLNYDVGNVVGGPGNDVLDTITAIDPIKVTFALDEPTYLALSRNRSDPNVQALRDQDLQIVLANDKVYAYSGKIYAFSPTVDPKTGTITVEAHVPNPDGLLRPGGFARVRVIVENRPDALLVPQTAITKSQGVDTVYVVDSKNEAVLRSVTLGPQYRQSFVVESGLNAGDRVIVEGTQKVQPGVKVAVQSG